MRKFYQGFRLLNMSSTLIFCLLIMQAQAQIITTVAGNGAPGYSGDGGSAILANLQSPIGVVADYSGNFYVADSKNHVVRKIDNSGIITTIAGNGILGYSGDGGPATAAKFATPYGLTMDAAGNLFISDQDEHVVRKVTAISGVINTTCTITRFAGSGTFGFAGDGGPANAATCELYDPEGLAVDVAGNLYIADAGNMRIRMVNTAGVISTFAGNGILGYLGDGGPATAAELNFECALATDGVGNLIIADLSNYVVREVSGGIINTIAGTGSIGFSGDGGPATLAEFNFISAVAVDACGDVFIADEDNFRVREINLSGIINTIAGNGISGYGGDGGPATSSSVEFGRPGGLAVDYLGNLYVSDWYGERVRMITNGLIPGIIIGPSSVCAGSSITLSDAVGGGGWTSSNTAAATVGTSSGIVTGVAAGTAIISYSFGGCPATLTITVNPSPSAISGITSSCVGITSALSDVITGGAWNSSNTAIATVGSGTGVVTGISPGTAIITYLLTGGCMTTATFIVSPLPSAITGSTSVCEGYTVALSDGVGGGTWTSDNTTIATVVASSGIVTGISAGTTTITYAFSVGCYVTTAVTVNPVPSPISGRTTIYCLGSTTTLSDATTGGVWTSTNSAVASIGSGTGIVTGITGGTAIISYTLTTGCAVMTTVTVYPTVPPITGLAIVCPGLTTTLSDASSVGTWSCSNTAIAGIGSGTGIVTGISVGTAIISYTLPGSCTATTTLSVVGLPSGISGPNFVCPGNTILLSDATAGGTWSSSNTAIATVTTGTGQVTGVSHGSATITYTVSSTGCYVTFNVQVEGVICTPCATFGGAFTLLGTSGAITTTTVVAGNYYIANDVTISGYVEMDNAIIMIAPGVTITVDPPFYFVLINCHLYSCDMWQGIVAGYTGTESAHIFVFGSLIEDANIAVSIQNPVPTGYAYGYGVPNNVFSSYQSIFNRNVVGVDIENFTVPSVSECPFYCEGTVFTSRDFAASTPPGYYPGAWPSYYDLTAAWSHPGDPFSSPYNIDNPTGSLIGGPYYTALCKNGGPAYDGIRVVNVGSEITSGTIAGGTHVPAAYSEIQVGEDLAGWEGYLTNLFDHLYVGIFANNTNLTSINNSFTNMEVDPRNYVWPSVAPICGDGIYANAANYDGNQKRLRVYALPGSTNTNQFFSFLNAVECYNYYQVIGQNSYMINKTPVYGGPGGPPSVPSGQYGYRISSSHYDTLDISTNIISNVNTGIGVWTTFDPWTGPYPHSGWTPSYQQFAGMCRIMYNNIWANPLGYAAIGSGTEAVQTGISVQNAIMPSTILVGIAGANQQLNVDQNNINDAYNGIYINYYSKQLATTNYNNIYLRPATSQRVQYGINHSVNRGSQMYVNYTETSTLTFAPFDLMRAYYAAGNTAVDMACNNENYVSRGFEFYLNNPGSLWRENELYGNMKGFVLNNAIIGHFGGSGTPTDNEWHGGMTYQTYVYAGANANSNPMYVDAGDAPGSNGGTPVAYIYSSSNIHITTGPAKVCPPPTYSPYPPGEVALYEDMVRQDIVYATSTMPTKWISQFELWKTLQQDTTLVDSSAALAQFATMAANSRYAYLTDIETQLAYGNTDSAMTMLAYNIDSMANTDTDSVTGVRMADSIAADNIVMNYQNFYGYYIKYLDTILSHDDSLGIMGLAHLCPQLNGYVVFQARALYSYIYNDNSPFNDDSACVITDTTYTSEWRQAPPGDSTVAQTNNGQQYKLYPNPSHGIINIQQAVPDNTPVAAEIWNVLGISIYKDELTFNGGSNQIRLMNVPSGVYLLKLIDSKRREFIFKFVEE